MCAGIQSQKMASFVTDSNHRVLWIAFIDQGDFEAMKSLSDWEAAPCDDNQFHTKIKMSTWAVFELCYRRLTSGLNKERKMALLLPHTLRLAVFRVAFVYMSLADHKGAQGRRLGA